MCAKPVIAVPACRRIIDPHPFHIVGEKYLTALTDAADALPWVVPALGEDRLDEMLERADGVFLTGSPSNVEPHHYGGDESRPGTLHDPERDATTLPLVRRALAADIPLLAVCRGYQEVNVVLGGTLHQHVEEVVGYHDHRENPDDPIDVQYGVAHEVTLVEGGMLRQLVGTATVTVNSLHAQGVARLAEGVTVEAIADDGLVEAFRIDDHETFALAVQWHPEWKPAQDALSSALFRAFGDACRAFAAERGRLRDSEGRATGTTGEL